MAYPMIKASYWHILLLAALLITRTTVVLGSEEVRICYHDGEWPPYIYFQREKGQVNRSVVVGATVELFNEVFKRIGLDYSTTMMPWKRCLYEVANFVKNNEFEVFTNGSYNKSRADKYYITSALYRANQGLFYSTKKFKIPPKIDSPKDLKKYKICGILGYNYTMYRALGAMIISGV